MKTMTIRCVIIGIRIACVFGIMFATCMIILCIIDFVNKLKGKDSKIKEMEEEYFGYEYTHKRSE